MPYIPLCNGDMFKLFGYSVSSTSNTLVEGWFKEIKTNILNGEKRLKCSRCIRLIRQHVLAVEEKVKLDIGKTRLTKQKTDNEHELLSQEMWFKKSKPSNIYFLGNDQIIQQGPTLTTS